MARRLVVVEDVFGIAGRGVTFLPGIVPCGKERFNVGDSLVLRRPDGTAASAAISGIGLGGGSHPFQLHVLLGGLRKEDVPVGTEIWSTDEPR